MKFTLSHPYRWLILLCCFPVLLGAQEYVVKRTAAPQQQIINAAFKNSMLHSVVINTVVSIDGNINVPAGKVLRFLPGGKIIGKGTINGGMIEAGYHQHIFDTTIQLASVAVNQYFSAKWYGAQGNSTDAHFAIQKSINTCINNNIRTLYLPAGKYLISQPLIIAPHVPAETNRTRMFCTLNIIGESSFWDSNTGSEIYTTFNNAFAIGIQTGKGCRISNLKIEGKFIPPFADDRSAFFKSSFKSFTDGASRDSRYSPYAGIVIDPFTNLSSDPLPADGGYPELQNWYGKANNQQTLSGSTATVLENLSIKGFVVGICSSPNGITKNAEITLINRVQFENCKLAISGGQAQEKANSIADIACWGGTHTIFATGLYGTEKEAGNWNISRVNIAGAVVRFIYNVQRGWFPTYISQVYAESLGSWGTINSDIACEISNCIIDFEQQEVAGKQTLLTSWGKNITYRNCNFRYYGLSTPLLMEGDCRFDNCFFSGELVLKQGSVFSLAHVLADPTDKRSLVKIILLLGATIVVLLVVLLYMVVRLQQKKKKVKTFLRKLEKHKATQQQN